MSNRTPSTSIDAAVYGILVDVSGSMQEVLNDDLKVDRENMNRAHAVFNTIFKTVRAVDKPAEDSSDSKYSDEQDPHVSSNNNNNNNNNNKFFALAFGLSDAAHQHCDLVSLFELLLSSYYSETQCIAMLRRYNIPDNTDQYIRHKDGDSASRLYELFGHHPLDQMAKQHGAPCAGEYIRKHVTQEDAGRLFGHFYNRRDLIDATIRDLPEACKDKGAKVAAKVAGPGVGVMVAVPLLFLGPIGWGIGGATVFATTIAAKKAEDVKAERALARAQDSVWSRVYDVEKKARSRAQVSGIVDRLRALYSTDDAPQITDGDEANVNKLLQDIKKYIYGRTPMCRSLHYAHRIFQLSADSGVRNQKRRLLVISDGRSTDGDPMRICEKLRHEKVIVACCYITNAHIEQPRELYDRADAWWNEGAACMFDMASTVSNRNPSLSKLKKSGWRLPLSGSSKLFVQANHPDIIEEFCDLINHLKHDNHAIADWIGDFKLNDYIIEKTSNEGAPHQVGGTCYANAVAQALHQAMSRIVGRDGGVPLFDSLRSNIIEKHGPNGANTERVLREYCKRYRLHYTELRDMTAVRQVLAKNRVVVARFRLSGPQWDNFSRFYNDNPTGILRRRQVTRVVSKKTTSKQSSAGGHAVVLFRCDPDCLIFMNSWGTGWADKGFFRVADMQVLGMQFFDVYWTLNDLSRAEKKAYQDYCEQGMTHVINQFVPTAYMRLSYQCPHCKRVTAVGEYRGDVFKALCPKCNKCFEPNAVGLIKSLFDAAQ